MGKMSRADLKNWPIFSLLEQKFILKIHMAVVYGNIFLRVVFNYFISLFNYRYHLLFIFIQIRLTDKNLHTAGKTESYNSTRNYPKVCLRLFCT